MKRTWVEIYCDTCGCADHYAPGTVDKDARENGWIITRDGHHFCDNDCKAKYKTKGVNAQPNAADQRPGAKTND